MHDPNADIPVRIDRDTDRGVGRLTVGMVVFAIAMAYVEAAVVVDLQAALGLPPRPTFPLQQATGPLEPLALIEVGREAATLVMLAAIGWVAARRRWEWLAWTAVAFGAWDIGYYAWLWVFGGWPTSPADWDLLFLLPVPWVGPVWAPVTVSLALIGFGVAAARRFRVGTDPVVRRRHLATGAAGGSLVVLSFTIDAPNLLGGGVPTTFAWPIFLVGLIVAMAGAVDLLVRHPAAPPAFVAASFPEAGPQEAGS